MVYEFDSELNPLRNYYLLSKKELKARIKAVEEQGKS